MYGLSGRLFPAPSDQSWSGLGAACVLCVLIPEAVYDCWSIFPVYACPCCTVSKLSLEQVTFRMQKQLVMLYAALCGALISSAAKRMHGPCCCKDRCVAQLHQMLLSGLDIAGHNSRLVRSYEQLAEYLVVELSNTAPSCNNQMHAFCTCCGKPLK